MLDYEIKSVYEDMEMRLIKSMKRNLQRHLDEEAEYGFNYPQWQAIKLKELKRYQRQNKDIINEEFKGYNKKISKFLKDELREGALSQFSKYKEAMGDTYKASKKLNKSFFRINDKKVNALIKTVNNDLKTGNKAVLRKTNDQYRKVIFQSQLYVANGAMTPKQAIDKANESFLRAGMNVIEYKDGRRVNIASYSEMAVRTAGKRASLMGEGEFRKKYKQPLIQISAHGTSCPLCKPWQGKILIDDVYGGGSSKDGDYPLLSYAMDQGLFHPNCRHGVMTHNDEIDNIRASYANGKDGSESDAQYQEDLNYINRKIKEYQRLEAGSLDETNIKQYKQKKKDWFNKKEDLLANVKLADNQIYISKEENKELANMYLDYYSKASYLRPDEEQRYKRLLEAKEKGYQSEIITLDSIDDCKQLLDKINWSINGDDISVDFKLLREATMETYKVVRKSPAILRTTTMNRFYLQPESISGNELASFGMLNIKLNTNYYSSYEKLLEIEKDNIATNWHIQVAKGNETKGIIVHELGHVVHREVAWRGVSDSNSEIAKVFDYLPKTEYGALRVDDIRKEMIEVPIKRVMEKENLTRKEVIDKYVSRYGKTDEKEMFAEVFNNSQLGASNSLGDELIKFLEEIGQWK